MRDLQAAQRQRAAPWGRLRRVLRLYPFACLAALFLASLVVLAILSPVLPLADPRALVTGNLAPPSGEAWFGGDSIGRDNLSRAIWGARISLFVGLAGVVPAVCIGWVLTAIAVYRRGFVEATIFRLVDAIQALPTIIFALAVLMSLGASVSNVIITIAFVLIPATMRTLRGVILGKLTEDYVLAARTIGCSGPRILLRHVLPNTLAPVIVIVGTTVPYAIVVEASLTFLGLGLPLGTPSWGAALLDGQSGIYLGAPWTALSAAVPLTLTVLSFNVVGDMLRDELDPRR